MKKSVLLICTLLLSQWIWADGIEFFHGTWEEALKTAKEQDRLIFVDAYAEWCGPCKSMARNVFTQEKVGDFYNNNFVNVKLDMEKGEGLTFRQQYPVSAFPTLFYIDYSGEVVHQVRGAQSVEGFLQLGELALSKIDRSKNYQEAYDKGDRSPELIYNLVKALNKAGKSSLAIANEYLRSQEDLTTDFNLRFLLEAAVEADSRIFQLLMDHRAAVEKLEGKEAVLSQIELACNNTVLKSIEYGVESLLEEAKSKMETYHDDPGAFGLEADRRYYRSMGNVEAYIQACDELAKKELKKNPEALHNMACEVEKYFNQHEECMQYAEKYAKMAAKSGELYTYNYTYARILHQNGKTDAALKEAEKALEMAKEMQVPGADQMVLQLIERIRS